MAISLEHIVNAVNDLPQPPNTSFQAISMLENPAYTMDQVSEFIVTDESVSLKLLQLANSAQYSGNSRTMTVRDAMVRIGVSNVKMILYQNVLEQSKIEPNPFFIELWRSSLYTAFLTKASANMLGHDKPDVCFTAGLICDVGLLMINQFSSEFCKAFIAKVASASMNIVSVETSVLKFTHEDIGIKLAAKWKLPNLYKTVIAHHHDPTKASSSLLKNDYKLLVSVHLANCMSPLFGPEAFKHINPKALELVDGRNLSVEQVTEKLQEELEKAHQPVNYFTSMMFGTSEEEAEPSEV